MKTGDVSVHYLRVGSLSTKGESPENDATAKLPKRQHGNGQDSNHGQV